MTGEALLDTNQNATTKHCPSGSAKNGAVELDGKPHNENDSKFTLKRHVNVKSLTRDTQGEICPEDIPSEDSGEEDEGGNDAYLAKPIITKWGRIESDPIPPKYQGKLFIVMTWGVYPASMILCGLPSDPIKTFAYCWFLWFLQMTGVLVGFHRYFAHRAYKCTAAWRILFGFLGCLSGQKGPLFWASQHRWHHKHCEKFKDIHSPYRFGPLSNPLRWLRGFFWSQGFWLWNHGPPRISEPRVQDLLYFKSIVKLEIHATNIHYGTALVCYLLGGVEGLVWVFMLATVLSWNAVQFVNSFSHICGDRFFQCRLSPKCNSRNVWWLSLVLLGDNWHNNHHAVMSAAKQGFHWYQLDVNWIIIWLGSRLGFTYDLNYANVDNISMCTEEEKNDPEVNRGVR